MNITRAKEILEKEGFVTKPRHFRKGKFHAMLKFDSDFSKSEIEKVLDDLNGKRYKFDGYTFQFSKRMPSVQYGAHFLDIDLSVITFRLNLWGKAATWEELQDLVERFARNFGEVKNDFYKSVHKKIVSKRQIRVELNDWDAID